MPISKILSGSLDSGKVLQVVSNVVTNTQVQTNSQSYVDATLTCAITPTSSSSKVLALVTTQTITSSSGDYGRFGLKRGSTDLEGGKLFAAKENNDWATIFFHYLDSPATTSATTYTLRFSSYAGSNYVYIGWVGNGGAQVMTLMEISA